jgi:hypothetical protein
MGYESWGEWWKMTYVPRRKKSLEINYIEAAMLSALLYF